MEDLNKKTIQRDPFLTGMGKLALIANRSILVVIGYCVLKMCISFYLCLQLFMPMLVKWALLVEGMRQLQPVFGSKAALWKQVLRDAQMPEFAMAQQHSAEAAGWVFQALLLCYLWHWCSRVGTMIAQNSSAE